MVASAAVLVMTYACHASGDQKERLAYEADIRPIIEQRCLRCHKSRLFAQGGYRMTSLQSVIEGGRSGAAVIPGDPEKSALVDRITRKASDPLRMPPIDDGARLAEADIKRIVEWIRLGAE